MKKNSLLFLLIIITLMFTFVRSAYALTNAELCADKSYSCFCNKSDSSKCTLQKTAPSGHGYNLADKTKCGCSENSPQGYIPYSETNGNIAFNICGTAGFVKAAQLVGWGLFIAKIVVPIILIVTATIDVAKAVASSDDKSLKAAVGTGVKRAIAAVLVFFTPTIVAMIFSLVSGTRESQNSFACLSKCIKSPANCSVPSSKLFK